mgnify:CR=1 FL=1
MKELLQKIEKRMDDFTVKKKLYILYIFCVLLPLIITDSVVFLIIRNSEMEKQKHDMTNIANAVSYNISSVVNNAGEMAKTIYTSRYIDDFHTEVGDTIYHICEFAERMQRNGVQTIPLRSSLPEKCFSTLKSTGEMIVITKGEKGYTPTGVFPQDASPREGMTATNAANGVTKAQEAAMVAGSMFGWETPAADTKNYDDQGIPIRPKAKDRDER